jgi:hypothetical protein
MKTETEPVCETFASYLEFRRTDIQHAQRFTAIYNILSTPQFLEVFIIYIKYGIAEQTRTTDRRISYFLKTIETQVTADI